MSEVIRRTSTEISIGVMVPDEDGLKPMQSIVFFGNPELRDYLATICYALTLCYLRVGCVSEQKEDHVCSAVALSCKAMLDEINNEPFEDANLQLITAGEKVPIMNEHGQVLLVLAPHAVTTCVEFGAAENTAEIKPTNYRLSTAKTPKRKIV